MLPVSMHTRKHSWDCMLTRLSKRKWGITVQILESLPPYNLAILATRSEFARLIDRDSQAKLNRNARAIPYSRPNEWGNESGGFGLKVVPLDLCGFTQFVVLGFFIELVLSDARFLQSVAEDLSSAAEITAHFLTD